MKNKRLIPITVSRTVTGTLAISAAALGLFFATPAQASGGWGLGMAPMPTVVASCTSYNLIPMKVDIPKGVRAGYVTGRLYNDRAGTVRKPALGMDTVYNTGAPRIGYLEFNPPKGSVDGDIFRVSLTLSSSPSLKPVVGSFEFSYNCSTGAISYPTGPTGATINTTYGDSLVILAQGKDALGNSDVEAWCTDSQGSPSSVALTLSKATLAGLPATNTLIDKTNSCRVPLAAYILTSGEYQVTIGPDEQGVINEIIFTGLPPANVHFMKFNVNQVR